MGGQVWGTLALNDHMRRDALLREVLLVVPVPATTQERERCYSPNDNDVQETWDPDGLDLVLEVLGSQRRPSLGGAPLAWKTDWDLRRRRAGKTRTEIASTITKMDPFFTARLILAMDDHLPIAVEAMAAYPSERACAAELTPSREAPDDLTAADRRGRLVTRQLWDRPVLATAAAAG